ncbi:UDP-3-O-(3-hydroxymyristoyl)glucosamine N-acyltransferase [Neolewinella aurantiaca]|uniref:UDP-3-O-(3-hydroxymyristoyl)glucosamine N-acyltransferase n=1 Tax=Neolewinella aurantiaca TaxID=2602767 RepID=A0A5C7FRH4_9BACT|nr:UDP-3-O-(3-hydroxymyristoyl)glucosamine N-acyltransferase [Neolewinella aurantiaca]TXF88711.1 UDP-3-O-(3-hydroxymyristoyl)glucosamine N-acyltransferase [Neolewinella aurantiaca]
MRLQKTITAADLAAKLGATLVGDGDLVVSGINEIHHVERGDLTFVDFHKYYDVALGSAASVILIDQVRPCPPGKALLVIDEPFRAYNGLVLAERPERQIAGNVDPSAVIGVGAWVAAGAVIGPDVVIGANCRINPNAVIGEGVTIEDNVVVGAGAIIGEEAFYFKKTAEGFVPWRSGGSVLLCRDVEVGANSTIARGVSSTTTIGKGTKLDAQVQIGHDCRIGEHCIIAAQVGIAGNTTVGDWCIFQGQVGIAQNLTIGDRTIILAKSGVSKSLEGGKEYFGYPAQEARTAFKDLAVLRRLRKK